MKRNIIIVSLLLLMPFMAGAQALKGSYFLDSSLNRNKLNPAFAPESDYFKLPVIGDIGFGVYSNLDIPTFFYPGEDGKLMTALHPNVTVAQLDKALPKHPYFDAEMATDLISFGFQTKNNSFWTVDVGFKTNIDTDIPRDLFTFLKKGTGTSGNTYNIANFHFNTTAALQASVGYSRDMSSLVKGLRVGAKIRYIAPFAHMGLNFDNVRLTTTEDKWTIDTEGYADIAMMGLDVPSSSQLESIGDLASGAEIDLGKGIIAGTGLSFDLGAEYVLNIGSIFDGTTFSASVTDLGFIAYSEQAVSRYMTKGQFNWEGINGIGLDSDTGAVTDDLMDGVSELVSLEDAKEQKLTTSSMPSFYVGAEMPIPYVKMMSIGLLYSARQTLSYARHELTVSYNLEPVQWFAFSANYSFLNTGRTMGMLLQFTPKAGPALTIGTDYFFTQFAQADFVPVLGKLPLSYRFNLNFGLAVTLGKGQMKSK